MILNAIAEKLKRQSKDDFKGRHFEAWLIVQAVTWYLRYPLSYRDLEEMFRERGFDGVGVSEVMKAAGLTHGAFYAHFASKEALAAEVLYGLVAACLLLAGTTRGLSETISTSPLAGTARWLGDTSYGVLLWHVLVLQVVFAVLDLRLFAAPFAATLLLVTIVSVGLAHLSWLVLERPVLRRAHRSTAAPERQPAPRA